MADLQPLTPPPDQNSLPAQPTYSPYAGSQATPAQQQAPQQPQQGWHNPYAPMSPYIPANTPQPAVNQINQGVARYNAGYNQAVPANYMVQHPWLTRLAGLATGGGLVNSLMLPEMAKQTLASRAANYQKAMQDYTDQVIQQQNQANQNAKPYNMANSVNNLISQGQQANQVNPSVPFLDPNQVYDPSYLESYKNQAFGPYMQHYASIEQQNRLAQNWNLAHTNPQTGSPGTSDSSGFIHNGMPIQGQVQNQGDTPLIMTPEFASSTLSPLASVGDTGLTQGTENYKYNTTGKNLQIGQTAEANASALKTGAETKEIHPNAMAERGLKGAQSFEATAHGSALNRGPGIGNYPPNGTNQELKASLDQQKAAETRANVLALQGRNQGFLDPKTNELKPPDSGNWFGIGNASPDQQTAYQSWLSQYNSALGAANNVSIPGLAPIGSGSGPATQSKAVIGGKRAAIAAPQKPVTLTPGAAAYFNGLKQSKSGGL